MKLKILNNKEKQGILGIFRRQFGFEEDLDYVFLLSQKDKIYIVNEDVKKIDLSKLRVNSYGLYIAELREDQVRLSIEGSQLIGPCACKNILELDEKKSREWLKGYDLEYKGSLTGFVLVRNKDDFLGCGKIAGDKLLNYVPKTRRIKASD